MNKEIEKPRCDECIKANGKCPMNVLFVLALTDDLLLGPQSKELYEKIKNDRPCMNLYNKRLKQRPEN